MLAQAVILAGGKGTRLQSRLGGRPKPLVDVLGVPLLERQLLALKDAGIREAIVLVNHEADQIASFCKAHSSWGLSLTLIDDGEPRGTAGAVLQIRDRLADEFLVVYGDTLFEVDLERLYAAHRSEPRADATLLLHPNDHPKDSDLVELDADGFVTAFHPYPHAPGTWLPNLVNAAMYVIDRRLLSSVEVREGGILDFAKQYFPAALAGGARLRGYRSPEYIKDIGTPDRLDRACEALRSGKIARASLRSPQVAVFLDRDGCLNRANGHIGRPERLEVLPDAPAAVALLNGSEYRTVLVTNQPVLARGECTPRHLAEVHAKLETVLGETGAYLDRIYVCPHHPDRGFLGEVPELKVDCPCRKPKPGMLQQAARDLHIDLKASWIIGDGDADVLAGRAAGVTTIRVRTGEHRPLGAEPCRPDLEVDNVGTAARFIVLVYPRLREALAAAGLLERGAGTDLFVAGERDAAREMAAAVLVRELRLQGLRVALAAFDDAAAGGTPERLASEAQRLLDGRRASLGAAGRSPPDIVVWQGRDASVLAQAVGLPHCCVTITEEAGSVPEHRIRVERLRLAGDREVAS